MNSKAEIPNQRTRIKPELYEDFEDENRMTFHNGADLAEGKVSFLCPFNLISVTDLSEGGRSRPSIPPDQNVFICMHFLGKFDQKICWHPYLGLAPPLGNPESKTVSDNTVLYNKHHVFLDK